AAPKRRPPRPPRLDRGRGGGGAGQLDVELDRPSAVRRFLLLLVMFAAVACYAASSPKHGVSPGGAPPRYSNAERLAAMMSVHGHAIWSDPELAGLKLKLLPLADALKVLSSDEGPGATSRRLRAIAKLLAYSWKTRRFTDEIAQLRGNVPHIETALNQQPGRLLLPSIERNPAWLAATIQNLLFEELRVSKSDD